MNPELAKILDGLSPELKRELIHAGQQALNAAGPAPAKPAVNFGPNIVDIDAKGFDVNAAPPGGWISDAERLDLHERMTRALMGEAVIDGAVAAVKAMALLGALL